MATFKQHFGVVMILQTLFIQESRNKAIVERAVSNLLENYIPFYGKIMSTDSGYDNEACQLLKHRVIRRR